MKFITPCFLMFFSFFANIAFANEDFVSWAEALKQDAMRVGISEKTVTETINHVELLPNVINLDRSQPEFVSPFLDYYQRHVNVTKIRRGQEMLIKHKELLSKVEAQYGVPQTMLVAFWGMETNYGRFQGNVDTLFALVTLAYDGRRSIFFRNQLFDAMRMIDAGHAEIEDFEGSWAGAFGHMQFMPSTFMTYAVDGDGDGKIDLVNSVPDAFSSAANYLSQVGWRKGEPAMLEVQLPEDFAWQNAQLNLRKPLEEWARLGVISAHISPSKVGGSFAQVRSPAKKLISKKINSKLRSINYNVEVKNDIPVNSKSETSSALPIVAGHAAIVLPQGWRGPAFMVFDNFDAVMDWNRSVNYALSVVQLAKRLSGEPPIRGGQFAEIGALSFQQMKALQVELNAQGFDAGDADGFPGVRTQEAVRAFQTSQRLPADGYASPNIFNYLKLISKKVHPALTLQEQ